jgi:hypothetical protein
LRHSLIAYALDKNGMTNLAKGLKIKEKTKWVY